MKKGDEKEAPVLSPPEMNLSARWVPEAAPQGCVNTEYFHSREDQPEKKPPKVEEG